MPQSWFHRLLTRRERRFSALRARTPHRLSSLPATIEFLEPRQLLAAPAVNPTVSAADDGMVILDVSTGEWQATRFDGSQFVSESLTTWRGVPEDIVTVHGDLWSTGQKELIHYESETGHFRAEWISGSANSQGVVAGWIPDMDLEYLTARDLNHDGFDDLIAMDRRTGKWAVSTFHAGNRSESRFVATWQADVNWQYVQFADLNADGWDDVIGFDPGGQVWNALLGGSSAFTAVNFSDSTLADNIVDVRLADFDGRAGTDIMYRDTTSGNWTAISLISGQFQSRSVGSWNSNGTWADVLAVDFWGLGRKAIVGRNVQTNQWQLTWSVGSGVSTGPISIWGAGTYADAFVADLNRDGREEIVAREVQTGKWFALGSPSIAAIRTELLGAWPAQSIYDTVQQGDFNGDLRPDWVGHDATSGAWRGLISVGIGGYNVKELAAPAFGYAATDTGVADYDLDGRLEVLSRDATTGNRLLVSLVDDTLRSKPYSDWTAYGNSWAETLTIDFNGDGDHDLLARDADSGNWWLTTFVATTPTTRKVARWNPAAAWQNRFTLDFDGNGSTDVLTRDAVTGNWQLLRTINGISTSKAIANWSPSVTWTDFQVVNLLGNGRPMIVARNAATNLWQGLWSAGSGFTTGSLRGLAAGRTYLDTRVVHFFGDSREVVATRDSQTGAWYAMWYLNGRFNLTSLGTWDPRGSWENVVTADLEADGSEELYGHDAESGQTWRLAFNGTSVTNTVVASAPMNQHTDLATVGRFTNSGRQELLVRDPATNRWSALQFDGLFYGYADLGVWSETASWTSTSVSDFNRDGRQEIVGYSTMTSAWTARAVDGSSWIQTAVSSLPASAEVGDVPGASNATLRATILHDVPQLAAAVVVRDIYTMAELLRNWVANAADSTLFSNPLMRGSRGPAESFYKYYVPNLAGSSCGGYGEFFIQVLKLFEIDSLTIGLGDESANLLHATVVVPILSNDQWRFELFDPTFNCSFDNALDGKTATYFDLVDAAQAGFSAHLQLNEAANDHRRFISAVPISNSTLVLEQFARGVYVYRWPGYGIHDYLDEIHDDLVDHGYSPGLDGFYQLLPQVKSVFANSGSGNPSTSDSQRAAFLVELAARGIVML